MMMGFFGVGLYGVSSEKHPGSPVGVNDNSTSATGIGRPPHRRPFSLAWSNRVRRRGRRELSRRKINLLAFSFDFQKYQSVSPS
jgi:hypothetical protein